jgi:uncharacterized membrane protein YbjE (DUF340 family)
MGQLLSLAVIIAFLLAGLLLGRIGRISRALWVRYLVDAALYLLLFFMGFRLGRNEEVANQLGQIGILSLAFTAATVAGTVVVLFCIYSLARRKNGKIARADGSAAGVSAAGVSAENGGTPETSFLEHLKEPGKLFLIVVLGFFAGRFIPLFPAFTAEKTTTWFVYFLLFFIGIQLNNSTMSLKEALIHPETLVLPLGTVIGSLLGGIAVGLVFRISVWKAMSVAAGFGWYSLSGVIISDLGDQVLGSAAFVSNILRESVALLSIPFFGASRYPRIGIGIAGATSMDVTLPLIRKSCGTRIVPLSVTHGALLSILVPVLVPLLYHLG